MCADLYPAVAPVCYDDVPIYIHCHSCGGVELAIAFAIGAELEQEFSLCVEHLHFRLQQDKKHGDNNLNLLKKKQ